MSQITYYLKPQTTSSFHLVGVERIRVLRQAGYDVDQASLAYESGTLAPVVSPAPIAMVDTLFDCFRYQIDFVDLIVELRRRHQIILGFEVADTTAISPTFVNWANQPGVHTLFVPSTFSRQAFIDSGVHTEVVVLPQGARLSTPSATFEELRCDPRPKILNFQVRDPHRKGADLLLRLAKKFPEALFVVKGAWPPTLEVPRNFYLVPDWLSPPDLAALYACSDVLISLHRGGAFELNCLEALCHGVPVVATAAAGVLEFLTPENAHLVRVESSAPLYPPASPHCGDGFTADLQDAEAHLQTLLKNLAQEQQRARVLGHALLQQYRWERALRPLLSRLPQLIA